MFLIICFATAIAAGFGATYAGPVGGIAAGVATFWLGWKTF